MAADLRGWLNTNVRDCCCSLRASVTCEAYIFLQPSCVCEAPAGKKAEHEAEIEKIRKEMTHKIAEKGIFVFSYKA